MDPQSTPMAMRLTQQGKHSRVEHSSASRAARCNVFAHNPPLRQDYHEIIWHLRIYRIGRSLILIVVEGTALVLVAAMPVYKHIPAQCVLGICDVV
jgi:hypothetical protein